MSGRREAGLGVAGYHAAEVVNQAIVVVARVKGPGEGQLPAVVHARNGLGAALGAGKRREEQARENRDDGDDDQEFNQSESQRSAECGVRNAEWAAGGGDW